MTTKFDPGQTVFHMHGNVITMTRVHSIRITANDIYYFMTHRPDTAIPENLVFVTQAECREAIKCDAVKDLTHELIAVANSLTKQAKHLTLLVLQQWTYKSVWLSGGPLAEATLGTLTRVGELEYAVKMIDNTEQQFKFENIKGLLMRDNRLTIIV